MNQFLNNTNKSNKMVYIPKNPLLIVLKWHSCPKKEVCLEKQLKYESITMLTPPSLIVPNVPIHLSLIHI